jgi:phosphomethylpyrimidine synthase
MKITQEVRDFARMQEANGTPLSSPGEGDHPQDGGGVLSPTDTEAGMAEMSKRFHDQGGELYVPAAE